MFFLFTMLLGHFNWGSVMMKNTYTRAFGKMTFISALASPIVITCLYLTQDYAIYLTNPVSTVLASGHVIANMCFAFLMYLVVEYPVKTFIGILLNGRLSHNKLLRKKYQGDKEGLQEEKFLL